MRLRTAHQFHPVIAYGDAIGNDAFELQRLFWASDVRSDLFAWEAKPEVRALVRDWHDLERLPKDALLLIHHSMGNDVLGEVAKLPQRKAIVYHNITPGHYFTGLNEHAKRYSDLGREQLKELAKVAEFGFADSEFNRQELEAAGLAKTAVVPILYDWEQFDVTPDAAVTRKLADERTSILVVGQILPQKAVHDVIAGFALPPARSGGAALLRRLHRDVGLVPRAPQHADRGRRAARRRDVHRQRERRAARRVLPRRDGAADAVGPRGILRAAHRGDALTFADRRARGRGDPRNARRRRHAPRYEDARPGGRSAREGRER